MENNFGHNKNEWGDPDLMRRALVTLAINQSLLQMGKPELNKVVESLKKSYSCQITDCYDRPQHLKKVLKDLYGESYNDIRSSIEQKLSDFAYIDKLEEFLRVLKD